MRRTVEAMLVVAIVLNAAYWSIWFTQRDWIASEHRKAGGAMEAVIVLLTLVFSVTVLTWSWRHRGELLSGSQEQTA